MGELEITRRTSLVAVCCSSASVTSLLRASSSWNKRTFSMAITAWSAKVLTNSICLSVNGLTSFLSKAMTPISTLPFSMGTAITVRQPPRSWASVI